MNSSHVYVLLARSAGGTATASATAVATAVANATTSAYAQALAAAAGSCGSCSGSNATVSPSPSPAPTAQAASVDQPSAGSGPKALSSPTRQRQLPTCERWLAQDCCQNTGSCRCFDTWWVSVQQGCWMGYSIRSVRAAHEHMLG